MLFSAHHLTKYYSAPASLFSPRHLCVRALDDISFSIPQGLALGVIGESGSGKTTLARILANLIPPTSGSIEFSAITANRAKDIQIISQNPWEALDPRMTIAQSLAEPLAIHRRDHSRERIIQSLERVGLDKNVLERKPQEFSGGQRQRIVIARAMALEPQLLICDEPTSSLDISVQAQILNLLLDLKETQRLSLVFVTHNIHLIPIISDSILVLYSGIMLEYGPRQDVWKHPAHPYTRELMDLSRNIRAHAPAGRTASIQGCPFLKTCPRKISGCSERLPGLIQTSPGHWVRCCAL